MSSSMVSTMFYLIKNNIKIGDVENIVNTGSGKGMPHWVIARLHQEGVIRNTKRHVKRGNERNIWDKGPMYPLLFKVWENKNE